MEFSDLVFSGRSGFGDGIAGRTFFPNGYGASVIRSSYSYGGADGLYELAVLRGNESDWRLTYDTPITDDVIGHLSESDVSALLKRIEALPPAA